MMKLFVSRQTVCRKLPLSAEIKLKILFIACRTYPVFQISQYNTQWQNIMISVVGSGSVQGLKVVCCTVVYQEGTSYSLVRSLLLYDVSFSHNAQRHTVTDGRPDRQTDRRHYRANWPIVQYVRLMTRGTAASCDGVCFRQLGRYNDSLWCDVICFRTDVMQERFAGTPVSIQLCVRLIVQSL